MQIQALKGTNLIQVKVSGVDKFLATDLANSVSDAFTQIYVTRSSTQRSQTKVFLEQKVAELKLKLDESEQELLQDRRSVGLTGDGEDFTQQTIALFSNRLVDAKTNLENARLAWSKVKQYITTDGNQSAATTTQFTNSNRNIRYVGSVVEELPIVDSNSLIQRDKRLVQEARRELAEISNRYGEKHPRVIDAMSNLNTSVYNLDLQISNVLASVENDYLVAVNLVTSIENDIRREEAKQFSRNEGKLLIKDIELTRNSNRKLYQDALSKLRANQEFNLQTLPLSLTDPANLPRSPVKPKKTLLTLLAFVVALCAATIFCFTREGMNESIRSISDVKGTLDYPVLGAVPFVKRNQLSRQHEPVLVGDYNKDDDAFTESILSIRTSMAVNDWDSQVIMITSSMPGEGKSTIAVNLALSLSNIDKVLLIEADMRRPSLSRGFGARRYGLSELLKDQITFDAAVRTEFIEQLDFLPAGSIPDRQLDLLASPKFEEIIANARKHYDRIIIDTAPVQAANDASIIGNFSDSVIYVTKSHSTAAPTVKLGIDRIAKTGMNIAGVVMSQVDLENLSSYGADYDYDYGETNRNSWLPVVVGGGNTLYAIARVLLIVAPLAAALLLYLRYLPKTEAIAATTSTDNTELVSSKEATAVIADPLNNTNQIAIAESTASEQNIFTAASPNSSEVAAKEQNIVLAKTTVSVMNSALVDSNSALIDQPPKSNDQLKTEHAQAIENALYGRATQLNENTIVSLTGSLRKSHISPEDDQQKKALYTLLLNHPVLFTNNNCGNHRLLSAVSFESSAIIFKNQINENISISGKVRCSGSSAVSDKLYNVEYVDNPPPFIAAVDGRWTCETTDSEGLISTDEYIFENNSSFSSLSDGVQVDGSFFQNGPELHLHFSSITRNGKSKYVDVQTIAEVQKRDDASMKFTSIDARSGIQRQISCVL